MFHSTTGLIGLGIGGALIVSGGLVIRRIVDIEV
jgi:hypothetical protein